MTGLGGIGSGIDFTPLIDGLVAAERAPIAAVEARRSDSNRQKTTLANLVARLKTLETRAKALDEARELQPQTVSSTQPDRLKVSLVGTSASPGRYVIDVERLATAQSNASRSYASRDPGALGVGNFSISVGGGASESFAYDSATSIDDLAAAINARGLDVRASVINDGGGFRLIVTGTETGANQAVAFSHQSGDPLELESNELVAAVDAQLRIDGLSVTRGSNRVTDLIQGVELELRGGTGAAPATVEVSTDREGLVARVRELAEAFNDVARFLRTELGKGAESRQGSLFADPAAQGLQRRMAALVNQGFDHAGELSSLKSLGLEVEQGGTLRLDEAKLREAIDADPSRVSSLLLGDGASGLSARLQGLVADYTTSGTGVLMAKQDGLNERIRGYDRQILRLEDRATRTGERLRRTFAALDQLLAQLNSQSSYLASLTQARR